ncbi:hypothetical protein [Streptomyces sp. V1I1]|uniref:hypothetical protein n=1 Tax=Streptomyces sp. V1I1 TaxID=3042272 RepID=UPI0027875A6A|nr:hypothetical protein [Streptomyces sp. V1I1]MDQ0943870.1 hypothetical protein [Streptomyces sp. V1I1]
MSEARTDTAQERPRPAAAGRAEAGGAGKHRGGAATTEESATPGHGRHRRPEGMRGA